MVSLTRVALPVVVLFVACSRRSSDTQAARPARPSTVVLTAEDIARSPGMSLEQLIVARVPGVTLTRAPDGHVALQIRGATTLQGNVEPLIVVDGIPLEPHSGGNLNAVNPHDVESIEVLRDAISTARYGLRGTNGVIVIKTKQPPQ